MGPTFSWLVISGLPNKSNPIHILFFSLTKTWSSRKLLAFHEEIYGGKYNSREKLRKENPKRKRKNRKLFFTCILNSSPFCKAVKVSFAPQLNPRDRHPNIDQEATESAGKQAESVKSWSQFSQEHQGCTCNVWMPTREYYLTHFQSSSKQELFFLKIKKSTEFKWPFYSISSSLLGPQFTPPIQMTDVQVTSSGHRKN